MSLTSNKSTSEILCCLQSNLPSVYGRWFGLILLPVVSFAADGVVAVTCFAHHMFGHCFVKPTEAEILAQGEAIDLSIQFILFWMPIVVLFGWWTNKPLTLLFGAHSQGCIIQSVLD